MSAFPGSPRLVKGGLVLVDWTSGAVQRVIAMQYNPDSLSRTLQIQAVKEGGDRSEAMRLTGAPNETIKVDAEIDATDQLELSDATAIDVGIQPQLAALETIVYPASSQVLQNYQLAQSGTLEIDPMLAPLTLFVWSKTRVLPVRVTDFSITEEAFDPTLNPIRAKVSLGMRVLNTNDLGFDNQGGNLFMAYHQQKERLAAMSQSGSLNVLGIGGV